MTLPPATLDDELTGILHSAPEALRDPWPVWDTLREQGPLHRHGDVTLATRYDDVRSLIKDVRLSASYHSTGARAKAIWARLDERQREAHLAVSQFESLYVVRNDGAEHERLRRIMHRAFTPRRMAELSDAVDRYAETALGEIEGDAVVDWMSAVAVRLPIVIIAELLGVPQSDREMIRGWSDALGRNRGGDDPVKLMEAHAAMLDFRRYVDEVVVPIRNERGGSELVRALLDAELGETLRPEELTAQFVVLLFAGFETTANVIGTGLLELMRHPEQWQLLVDDPSRAEDAVEELLRWVAPVQWVGRVAIEDIPVGDEAIHAGETVFPLIASANRDPNAFSDPDTMNILRDDARQHLSFGVGPHFCLGNTLARIEARVVFERLAREFPDVEIVDDDPPWGSNAMLRKIQNLPVRLGARRSS